MKRPIRDGLIEFLKQDPAPWHMPGHKRCALPETDAVDAMLNALYRLDVTEVPGTDDLHVPTEMIRASMDELKRLYHTEETHYVVGGATCGILSAVTACVRSDATRSRILIARNCHKSVYNITQLLGLTPVYLSPGLAGASMPGVCGGVEASALSELLDGMTEEERKSIALMVLTGPTYEGAYTDIAGVVELLHAYGIRLLVDEAHGAHLPFYDPERSALATDADLVVQSLHKTMPAMTQSALLHVNDAELLTHVSHALDIYETSSPSYPMLLSMETAIAWADDHRDAFERYRERLAAFYRQAQNFKHLKLVREIPHSAGRDDSRIVICADGDITGRFLGDRLAADAGMIVEMTGCRHAVLISTVMDDWASFEKLLSALDALDRLLDEPPEDAHPRADEGLIEKVDALVGAASKENIFVYPPGSYVVAVGETVSPAQADEIKQYITAGKHVMGL